MSLTTTQVLNLCDSVAKAIDDYTAAFITNTGTNTPLYSTITAGVSGTGSTATVGRILNFIDNTSEQVLLKPVNTTAASVTAYITSVRSISGFYQQYYSLLDAIDLTVSGLNAYLTTNTLQVNASFANAFNAYQVLATTLGYRTSVNAPTAIATANFFPSAAIDTMWGFTSNGATTFSSNAIGTNTSSSVSGGGVGQFYIYKNNSGNAAGGATFTIQYTNAAGTTASATYSTSSGTPSASGSLSSGYAISTAIGSAIVGVTGSGMTSAEQYTIGMKLTRASAY